MKITLNIPDQRVTDLLHGHGGGSSPWLHELVGKWTDKNGFRVKYDREQDEEGDGKGRMRIGRRKVTKGLAIMAEKEPYQFSQFLEENDDEIAFDTALQCIIFGKCVYA